MGNCFDGTKDESINKKKKKKKKKEKIEQKEGGEQKEQKEGGEQKEQKEGGEQKEKKEGGEQKEQKEQKENKLSKLKQSDKTNMNKTNCTSYSNNISEENIKQKNSENITVNKDDKKQSTETINKKENLYSDNSSVHKFKDDSIKKENVEKKMKEKEKRSSFNNGDAIEINKNNNEQNEKRIITVSRDDKIEDINKKNVYALSGGENNFNNSNDKGEKKENNNYYQFENFKEYYLKCPDCQNYILKIVSITFDNEQEDYLVLYKCFCNKRNEKYFYQILSEMPNYCENHKNQLTIYYCEICNISFCEGCKNEHKEHKIHNILNKEVINDDIIKKILEKKEEFKGTKIIQKLYDLYKFNKNKNIPNHIKDKENVDIVDKKIISDKKVNYKDVIDIKNVKPNNEKITENILYKNIKTLRGHKMRVTSLIKLSNNLIASGSEDETIKIWDINGKNNKYPFMNKNLVGGVLCLLEFEPGMLLAGTKEKLILLLNLNDKKTDEINHYFIRHEKSVNALVKCDENHLLADLMMQR